MAGRPKSDNPAKNLTTRVPDLLRRKIEFIAGQRRRRVTELLRIMMEDEVAAYEKQHGPIDVSAPPTSSQGA